MTETIAFATTSANKLGADPGISIESAVMEDGILREHVELARETTSLSLDDEYGDLDVDAADVMLAGLGYSRIDAWTESGGQWAAKVEQV